MITATKSKSTAVPIYIDLCTGEKATLLYVRAAECYSTQNAYTAAQKYSDAAYCYKKLNRIEGTWTFN